MCPGGRWQNWAWASLGRGAWLVGGTLAFAGLVAIFGSQGGTHGPLAAGVAVAYGMATAGTLAAMYLLAALGWGRTLAPLWRSATHGWAIQAAAGLALLLTLSHVLGWVGALTGPAGVWVARGTCGVGLVLVALQATEALRVRVARGPVFAGAGYPPLLAAVPALALLVVAASTPPGWLWDSEGRGYDVLSYHLQLPQEWLAGGRIVPLEHNVYSFLPGYMEAAFVHLAAMAGVEPPGQGDEPAGVLAGDGLVILAAQFLHAGVGILAAVFLTPLVQALARLDAETPPAKSADNRAPAGSAGRADIDACGRALPLAAVFLSVPWVIVTGSQAYNDLGVLALMGGALITALERHVPLWRRGVMAGWLVGVACGCKPTALLLGVPPVALAFMWTVPARRLACALGGAAVAGMLALTPWLTRNALPIGSLPAGACPAGLIRHVGNPIFPRAAGVLGRRHWSSEQVARYAQAHSFSGSLGQRLGLLVFKDMGDPAGPRHRGLAHEQWGVFWALVPLAGVLAWCRWRRATGLLAASLAVQLLAWLWFTHIQSRFLLPLAVPGAAMVALAVLPRDGSTRAARMAPAVLTLVAMLLAAQSARIYARQGTGPDGVPRPGAMLVAGVGSMTGHAYVTDHGCPDPEALPELGPTAFVNLTLPARARVLLVGEARALYCTRSVVYASTWDRLVLADVMATHPDDPAAWTAALREHQITHALVNFAELARLERSRFLDPGLDPRRIERWVREGTRVIRRWPDPGVVLVALDVPAPGASAGGDRRAETSGSRPGRPRDRLAADPEAR